MGNIRIKYLVIKRSKRRDLYYWQPKSEYLILGQWVKCPFPARRIARESGKLEDACTEAAKLNEHLQAWRAGEAKTSEPVKGSVHWLAVKYYQDEMYLSLAAKSQKEYRRQLEKNIFPVFADIPCEKVSRQQARAFYHELRPKPREAQYAVMVARRLFQFGRNIGAVSENPFTEIGVKKPPLRGMVWSDEQIEAFKTAALAMNRRSMWLAMVIGGTIGTDTSTTRLLAWENYDGETLRYARRKTGVRVAIPLKGLPALKAALNETKIKQGKGGDGEIIINEITGKAYTEYNFNHVFREVADKAAIPKELQFKDLRRTAVVKLALAGCTNLEIASFTGWEPKYCEQIIKHYLPTNAEVAGNAIEKLLLYQPLKMKGNS